MPINKNELTMERVRKALSGFSGTGEEGIVRLFRLFAAVSFVWIIRVGGGDLQGDRSPGAEPCAVASGTVRREGR